MARYSRRRGPNSSVELVDAFTVVPEFTITRTYGRGNLLIDFVGCVQNTTGVSVNVIGIFIIDGVFTPSAGWTQTVLNGSINQMVMRLLESIVPGEHVIQVAFFGSATSGDLLTPGQSELTVLELPAWDQDDDLITL